MRILVVGDQMVDRYFDGAVVRLNPEKHSAPLVSVNKTVEFPGGAGNVARNLEALGTQVTLVSGSGSIVKNRVVDPDGVVCRFDIGDELSPIEKLPNEEFDAAVVSDYRKGSITQEVAEMVCALGLPLFVDTKSLDPGTWLEHATCFFPNAEEFKKNHYVYRSANMVLLKQGRFGATLISRGRTPYKVPSKAKKVVNVAGAGDTVIAAFVAVYCHLAFNCNEPRASLLATEFAMELAGLAVAQSYTYAPDINEVVKFFPEAMKVGSTL